MRRAPITEDRCRPLCLGPAASAGDRLYQRDVFLSVEQRDTLVDTLSEGNTEEALHRIVDGFDPETIEDLRNTFQYIGLYEERREYLFELTDVFEDARYWVFSGSIATQFEGIIRNYLTAAGATVEIGDRTDELHYWFEERTDAKPLRLNNVIDDQFDGGFNALMHPSRRRRNCIAHGEIPAQPEETATLLLVAFYAFNHHLLNKYYTNMGASTL